MSSIVPTRRNAPLHTEFIAISGICAMPGAPRQHPKSQIRALTKSFEAFGQVIPILIDADHRIISGHAQWQVAQRLGMAEVMVIRIEYLAEPQIKALMIALNRLGDLSKWDDEALNAILLDLHGLTLDFDIEATGFAEIEIDLRIEGLGDALDELEHAIPSAGPSVVQPGELWQLGDHRLLCGNALDPLSWILLMGDEKAALGVTDPPYNVRIDGHVSGLGQHKHREFAMASGEMTEAEFIDFLTTATRHMKDWSAPGALHYVAMDWRHLHELTVAGRAVFDRHINTCIWTKPNPGMGSFYRSAFEAIMVFAKAGAPTRNNVQLGRFGRSRSNVWSYPGANSNFGRAGDEGNPLAMHPTVKPLALIANILLDASVRGDIVTDPFAGSGTIFIAAEKLGRRARGIELDPLYCDTAIRRWQSWTGQGAVRVADGMAFSALEGSVNASEKPL